MSKEQTKYILYGVIIGVIIGGIISLIIAFSFSHLQFETRDWILTISLLVVITGWFITFYSNKKNEQYKRYLDFRTEMIKSVLDASTFWIYLKNSNPNNQQSLTADFISKLETAQVHVLMYGTESEIKLIDNTVTAAANNQHIILEQNLFKLTSSLREDLRKLIIIES